MRTRVLNGRLIRELGCWMAIVAGMWVYSYSFEAYIPNYALGLVAWPRAILILILVCVFALALSHRGVLWQPARGDRFAPEPDAAEPSARGRRAAIILATFALPLAYVWLLPRAGFLATTPFFLAGYMYIFGQRRPVHLIGTSLAIYVVVVVVFSKFLFLPLPTGVWPGFYDFSNAILVFLG